MVNTGQPSTWNSACRGHVTVFDGGRGLEQTLAPALPSPFLDAYAQLTESPSHREACTSGSVEVTGNWSSFFLCGPQRRQED